ncbi:PadR family transcriptional regulator [Flexivirga endophytica]|uniref:PadR family transcriptional regulator n=1 Tax=Flexivirga endophytica TaxID=1849103 RepID=A0A916SWT2_9MICO|nr:PadR family transcriptional regulator [Flexivirga endophytica]GGB20497.1 PadR family transcriptional regulator [Flexivirga endophytica]GHB58320.1 PadR family transcriptional regulator [Flexivirga endophytica]
MISALGHALLGLLAREPTTGYRLTRLMDRDLAYFWAAKHSQIYPELARLERDGHVRHTVVGGAGPRPTKRYELTADGRRALVEWLATEPEPTVERDPTLLRVSSLWLLEREAARAVVGRVRRLSTERLALYERFAAEFDSEPAASDPTAPVFATRATVEMGIRSQRARLDWCDWLDQRLA